MDGLKQRIIGALVLVSLAVIFVPMIFDEPHQKRQTRPVTIPEEPPFPEVDLPSESGLPGGQRSTPVPESQPRAPRSAEPSVTGEAEQGYRLIENDESRVIEPDVAEAAVTSPEPVEQVSDAGQEADPETLVAEESPAEQPAEFSGSLEGAWVVQLGSFGNAGNARRLRDNVRNLGYGAHLQTVTRGDTTLTRVFSGPFVNEGDAKAAKNKLDDEFSLNSLVTTGAR